jgi:hypothetical protein
MKGIGNYRIGLSPRIFVLVSCFVCFLTRGFVRSFTIRQGGLAVARRRQPRPDGQNRVIKL